MDYETLRSSIHPRLMKHAILRGTLFAGTGALVLLAGGTFLSLAALQPLGAFIFFTSFFLIALGFIPFRKLYKLENKPHLIQIDETYFVFCHEGKPLFRIPLSSLKKISYSEKKPAYGLCLTLERPLKKNIEILQSRPKFDRFLCTYIALFPECDIFLPFFTESALRRITSLL